MNRLVDGCLSCEVLAGKVKAPGGVIYEDEHWVVDHNLRTLLLGYLIIKPKRHCEHLAELTSEESATLGPIIKNTCLALSRVLKPAPEKVYVCSFGEEVKHIHFHVIPRTSDMPEGSKAVRQYLLTFI